MRTSLSTRRQEHLLFKRPGLAPSGFHRFGTFNKIERCRNQAYLYMKVGFCLVRGAAGRIGIGVFA